MHNKNVEETLKAVESSAAGLNDSQVLDRQAKLGKNVIESGRQETLIMMLLAQFKDFIVLVLLAAASISMLLGELKSAITIFVVLIVNTILGVVQKKKAQNSLEALKKLSSPVVKVLRNGEKCEIISAELTVGDIIYLDAGDLISADGRIIESHNLQVSESALTGEAQSVGKFADTVLAEEIVLSDRINMVFSGCFATYGRGVFVVTEIGMNTETGKIAKMISDVKERKTPIQKKLDAFGQKLSIVIIIVCILVFAISVWRDQSVLSAFMFAVALAVAAVPEALASIVTISLAIGTSKMSKRNVIVRRLPVVEALGSVGVICSDKTGTLTQNKMTVKKIFTFDNDPENIDFKNLTPSEKYFLFSMTLCNDANIKQGNTIGDPTETALLSFGEKGGFDPAKVQKENLRISELSFDSDRKMMSTLNSVNNELVVLTKGAPDVLLTRCTKILVNENEIELSAEYLTKIEMQIKKFSSEAFRVLAFAYKKVKNITDLTFSDEHELVFIGLCGMIDPPRPEAKAAVAECIKAGILPVMITGDHKDTAEAIARELGIFDKNKRSVVGKELDGWSEAELIKNIEMIAVYARVTPEHKIRIVKAWQQKNMIVAMTGDGVNDAPALRQADIGIAMGISGTEVSKEASAMILTDDNFATIVHAVESGRHILGNIKKSIAFLLTGNLSGVLSVLYCAITGYPNAFLPVQLLFVNLATDSLPAIVLAFEKGDAKVMHEKPQAADSAIFNSRLTLSVVLDGIFIAIMIIIAFLTGYRENIETARTMGFATLVLSRLLHGFNLRTNGSIFKYSLFSNKFMLVGVSAGLIMLALVLYVPFLADIFQAEFLIWSHMQPVLVLSIMPTIFAEIRKYFMRKFQKKTE